MPLDVAQRAIDFFFAQPPWNDWTLPQIYLTGGEPLLHWALVEQCGQYAASKKDQTAKEYRLVVNTNGVLLDQKKACSLQAMGADVILSCDGVQKAHDACRRRRTGDSTFADTMQALRVLLECVSNPAVCLVVSPENVRFLADSIDMLLDKGIRRIIISPNFLGNWEQHHLNVWRQGYEHVAACFEEAYRRRDVLNINLFSAKIIAHLTGGRDPSDFCGLWPRRLAVAPSGRVYVCQIMVGDDDRDVGLVGNVWGSLNLRSADMPLVCKRVRPQVCKDCEIERRCRKYLWCGYRVSTGKFHRPDGLICWHERTVIGLADKAASRLFKEKNESFLRTFYGGGTYSPELF